MNEISSFSTYYAKRVMPLITWYALAMAIICSVVSLIRGEFLPPLMMLALYFGLRDQLKRFGNLADGVWDCGNHLLIRDGRNDYSVDFRIITGVEYRAYPPHLRIKWNDGGAKEISFVPSYFRRRSIARDLRTRAANASRVTYAQIVD